MALDNYRDLSSSGNDVSAGFQFEFFCTNCTRKWKSPFKPFRMGQITGLLTRFSFLFSDMRTAGRASGNFADIGSRGAREKALAEAMQQAEQIFTNCPSCGKAVCGDCFDTRADSCVSCLRRIKDDQQQSANRASESARERSATGCPQCGAAGTGGRFCPECGFDMAATHKGCPGCGAMVSRQSRYCTDCGHGF